MEFFEDDIVELTGKPESGENVPLGSQGEVEHVYRGGYYEVFFRFPDGTCTSAAIAAENLVLIKRLKKSA